MSGPELSNAAWRTSTHSQAQTSECVEVAQWKARVAVRDSKNPDGPVLALHAATWRSLLQDLKNH
ncbi:DUF397 domain-containing protein [Spirillospora sp. NPDC029432]|uniref:DUF397 domain-containing protein n=1 Tax=Spirillospora sp. NPDC029432 TaxID=3154599 RepID=UPI003456B13D